LSELFLHEKGAGSGEPAFSFDGGYVKILLVVLLLLSLSLPAFSGEYSTDKGEVLESLGDDDYMSTRGCIVHFEDMGDDDYLTTDDKPVEKIDSDDYMVGDDEMIRDMGEGKGID